jgi:pimeloyl-ACP methyl ester carboxylesterase
VSYSALYAAFSEICNTTNEDLALCGLSLGGVLALNYTIENLKKVKSLVLIAAQYKMPVWLLKLQNILFRPIPRTLFQQNGFSKHDFMNLYSTMAELDFSNSLHRISCLVLVVCGDKDYINKKASIRISNLLQHSDFKEIEGAGHEVNMEAPERLASVLKRFYDSVKYNCGDGEGEKNNSKK